MPEYTLPEIQRTSLTAVVLTLKCLGVHDVIRYTDAHSMAMFSIYICHFFHSNHLLFFEIRFPYLDPPEERFILDALKQLYQFDAIDRSGFGLVSIKLVV